MAGSSPRALVCAECGAAFACTGNAECWCAAESYRLPMPDAASGGDCLCPACLRAKAEQSARPTEKDRHRTVT
ncbi:MAG: hypothetical protein KIT48_16885 [Pseudolabrys sp.]|nr:hypothetical protein [Pseudolabrys sp.]